jgi:hypothetical protein
MWLERNAIEHDHDGDPEGKKWKNLIVDIQGRSRTTNYKVYNAEEVHDHILQSLPKDNLQMIVLNIRGERNREKLIQI